MQEFSLYGCQPGPVLKATFIDSIQDAALSPQGAVNLEEP